jgi:hexosaminidase
MDLDFIPSVWNNTWGGGREDMIYKLANMGFKSVMSNSSAFYFDMTDDMDIENPGLSWSGYVNYKDSWGTEPLDVFANKVKIKSLGIDTKDLKNKVKLQEKAKSNFLGIQSQLWTETAANAYEFDRMLMPNLIVFSERAWSSKEPWIENTSAELQEPELTTRWNTFVNTVGKRHLPYLSSVYNELLYDLPKPGAVVEGGILRIRQQFPGLEIRFTRDGTTPTRLDEKYTTALEISPSDQIVVRTFDPNGRGGNPIQVN